MKRDNATLWSALLPDERLKRATSNRYRVTTKDGRIMELDITSSQTVATLKGKGWTVERIGEKS